MRLNTSVEVFNNVFIRDKTKKIEQVVMHGFEDGANVEDNDDDIVEINEE